MTSLVVFRGWNSIVPYVLVDSVGISGCDFSYVVHNTFLHHSERVGELGEDRWLVYIQHLDVYLSV